MSVKLRLQRHGRTKSPFYFIVAADSRVKRDGHFIERIGDYNPLTTPATINVDVNKAVEWMVKGASPTNTVKAILKYKGAMYKKHLLRGQAKGVVSAEQVETKYAEWVKAHEGKLMDHLGKVEDAREKAKAKRAQKEAEKRAAAEAEAAAKLKAREEALLAAEAAKKAEEAPATDISETASPATDEAADNPEANT